MPLFESVWFHSIHFVDAAKRISAKFKILIRQLKTWDISLSLLKDEIDDANCIISMLDYFENYRELLRGVGISTPETEPNQTQLIEIVSLFSFYYSVWILNYCHSVSSCIFGFGNLETEHTIYTELSHQTYYYPQASS